MRIDEDRAGPFVCRASGQVGGLEQAGHVLEDRIELCEEAVGHEHVDGRWSSGRGVGDAVRRQVVAVDVVLERRHRLAFHECVDGPAGQPGANVAHDLGLGGQGRRACRQVVMHRGQLAISGGSVGPHQGAAGDRRCVEYAGAGAAPRCARRVGDARSIQIIERELLIVVGEDGDARRRGERPPDVG